MDAINWSHVNDIDKIFWEQNVRQFWVDTEIPLSADKGCWKELSQEEKETYQKVLAGLTLLDTHQGSIGMPMIGMHIDNPYAKAVMGFMGVMEHMHAKSYSSIFHTLCTTPQIDELFDWVNKEKILTEKMGIIQGYYEGIKGKGTLYLAMVCSVFLESFLFYSGFFYPLYLAGKGQMVNSGEIINLIIRDESVHGVYVGLQAKELFSHFSQDKQAWMNKKTASIFRELFDLETEHSRGVYSKLGLEDSVIDFMKYNANKAHANCGLDLPFPDFKESSVNPIVMTGLDTSTKLHDFFSTKGNGYIKAMNTEELTDEDFF